MTLWDLLTGRLTTINSTELWSMRKELQELREFREATLDFMAATGVNPISLNIDRFDGEDRFRLTRSDTEKILTTELSMLKNPTRDAIYRDIIYTSK